MQKNIHFVVPKAGRPAWADANIEGFRALNTGWNLMFHDTPADFDMPPEYTAAYAVMTRPDTQSDVLRMAALDVFGGWYFDWDVWPIKGIDQTNTAGMIGDKLFLYPIAGANFGSAICAADQDSSAWPIVRKLMLDLAEGRAFRPWHPEGYICDSLRKFHVEHMAFGDPKEFTVTGRAHGDRDLYQRLLAGEQVDLRDAAFLHGWNNGGRKAMEHGRI